jgi:hypothetical protein
MTEYLHVVLDVFLESVYPKELGDIHEISTFFPSREKIWGIKN